MKKKKNTIDLIYNDDLINFLKSIKHLELIEKGEIFCKICGTPINLKNLQGILPITSTDFSFICNNPECVQKLEL